MLFWEIIFSFLLTVSFALLFNVKKLDLIIHSGIGGAISGFTYTLLINHGYSYSTAYLIATIFTAFYCEIMAKKLNTTVPTLLIAALIRMAPGGGVYYTLLYLIQDRLKDSLLKGVETSIIAGSMALGIILVSTFFKIYYQLKKKSLL